MYQTLAGQSVDFVLVISKENAAKKLLVRALVNHEGEANTQQELPVQDNGDRSFVFSYCPETDGLCNLSVMVEGENVYGSPFMWKVRPKVHYSKLPECCSVKARKGCGPYRKTLLENKASFVSCLKKKF